MYPLDLLKEYLKGVDEVQILELLDISSEDLILYFEHKIIEKRAYLEKEVELFAEMDTDQTEKHMDHEE